MLSIVIMIYYVKMLAIMGLKKPHRQLTELGNIYNWSLLLGGMAPAGGRGLGDCGDACSVKGGDGEILTERP